MKKISAIIPVYQAQKTIAQAIESVLAQSYKNFELILVDDGSTDDSAKVCIAYSQQNKNIFFVHQINGGVSSARQIGVQKASGYWITFIDADDFLPIDAFEKLIKLSSNVDAEIVVGNARFFDESLKQEKKNPIEISDGFFPSKKYLKMLIKEKVIPAPWAKLFKRNLFDDKIFELPRCITCGEDLIMNLRLGKKAKRIKCIDGYIYHYRASCVNHTMTIKADLLALLYGLGSVKNVDLCFALLFQTLYRKLRKFLLGR